MRRFGVLQIMAVYTVLLYWENILCLFLRFSFLSSRARVGGQALVRTCAGPGCRAGLVHSGGTQQGTDIAPQVQRLISLAQGLTCFWFSQVYSQLFLAMPATWEQVFRWLVERSSLLGALPPWTSGYTQSRWSLYSSHPQALAQSLISTVWLSQVQRLTLPPTRGPPHHHPL